MGDLFGGGANKRKMEAQQRQSLAALAAQQSQIDQAGASGGGTARQRGRGLLTFLPSLGGSGETKLG